jgi:hypothetical protein
MTGTPADEVEALARRIHAHGLATPALMLFDTFAPLSWIGEQALTALTPLLPQHIGATSTLLRVLQDEKERARLRELLTEDQRPTRPEGIHDQ